MLCVARADSGVASLDDVIRGGKSLIVGTTGPGSNIHDFPAVLKDALNVNFRLVPGYPGAADITLALQRNEVGGVCRPWESIRATNPDWLTSSPPYVVPLVQQGAERDPELPNVPLAEELVQTQEQRQLIRAAGSTLSIAKPFVAPPGVPAERVAALRQAFEATMHDPELLREADTAKIDLSFKTAERVQAIVNEVLDTPPGVVQRLKAATEGGS
jgi:tripartite-type tricarboxylate transporter receptor subunit TctC